MKLTCITPATGTPVTLEETKSFCRALTNDDDLIFEMLINAATDFAQNVTGRQLCTATYEIVVGGEQSPLRLPKAPLKAITSVMCNGIDLDYSLHYDIDVAFIEFVASDDVTIEYTCGYDVVPYALKAWLLNKVSTLYENREQIIVGQSIADMPSSVIDCVLDQFKVRYL